LLFFYHKQQEIETKRGFDLQEIRIINYKHNFAV
jgi:hypothetical protein